ncbi:uncharacterized protein LOC124407275 [Diprion similis]|uniref:uncharacterized protein LOC124407275 n=1 Tax=Diprion similis TaxID=362088 RepID=UPI001EF96945|nr:uncharacterized protein LOC124407275 [Diprion similis]XP_046739217.1 uncharacterized protein LOC124407275 [Diprion similis]
MIIVLFHALYYFGRYVYRNFYARYGETGEISVTNQPLNVTEADYDFPPEDEHVVGDFKVKFFPPVYVQRYNAVHDVLVSAHYHRKIRKVIDFGCAELTFAIHLKNTEGIQEIICVDVDRPLLETFQTKVAPLHCDYLAPRTEPLTIHVCEGSVTHNDKKLANSDAVICIELIEHLHANELETFPRNVFGFIKPQVAIITTPNADFNVLFKNRNGFRHPDHKFEWTRAQFQDWANNIILLYPDYEVSFHGIGAGPPGTEMLGSCSQMAVFHRHTQLPQNEEVEGLDGLLKTVVFHEYPYRTDNRSDEQKILDEAVYYIRLFSSREEELAEEIPLTKLMFSVEKFRISVDILRSILEEAQWAIADREDGPVVLVPPQSGFSTNSDWDVDDFLDNDYRHHENENDWDTSEVGAPPGHHFNTYMERNTENYTDEDENWDNEVHSDTRSSNLNLNENNLVRSDIHVTENPGDSSESQLNMEDSNNEDPLLNSSQDQLDITPSTFSAETELSSNSVPIESDPTNIGSSNDSSNMHNSLQQNLSLPLLVSGLSETLQSLENDGDHSLSAIKNHNLPKESLQSLSQNEGCYTGTCVRGIENCEINEQASPLVNPVPNFSQHMQDETECSSELVACSNLVATENDIKTDDLQIDTCLPYNQVKRILSTNSPSSCKETEANLDTDFYSDVNETSSVSTEEATLLLSCEKSLLIDNEHLLLKEKRSLENERSFNNDREHLKLSVDSITQNCNESTSYSHDNHNLQCSTSIECLHTDNEGSYLSISDFPPARSDTCKHLYVSYDSVDPHSQKLQTNLLNKEIDRFEGMKSQDSMSFKSISDCSLDLQPKYTSTPQILADSYQNQMAGNDKAQELSEQESVGKYRCVPLLQSAPDIVQQFLMIKGRDSEIQGREPVMEQVLKKSKKDISSKDDSILQKKSSFEGEKLIKNDSIYLELRTVENVFSSTSQLSLQSSSDISLSGTASTASSNVDRWYVAETNPMYQRDIVVLKGGNDTADNPNEVTASDSDATISSKGRSDEGETGKAISHTSKTSDHYCEHTMNVPLQHTLNEDIDANLDQTISSFDNASATLSSSDRVPGRTNVEFHCELTKKRNYSVNVADDYSVNIPEDEDHLEMEKIHSDPRTEGSTTIQYQFAVVNQSTSALLPECKEIEPAFNTDHLPSIAVSDSNLANLTANLDESSAFNANMTSETFVDSINNVSSSKTATDSFVSQSDHRLDIYVVTKTLTDSTKTLSEKVDVTKRKLEATLESQRKLATSSPLMSAETELVHTIKNVDYVQNAGRNCDIDLNATQILSQQPQNSNHVTTVQVTTECLNPDRDLSSLSLTSFQGHSNHLNSFDFSSEIKNEELPLTDIFNTHASQSQPVLLSNFKSIPSNETVTLYNVGKMKKDRNQLQYESEPLRAAEYTDSKSFSPESLDTPPNSWSPEIMDSGYPNSASAHDVTPECELSSIANDRISDSDSTSVGEVPVPGFYEFVEVENGDLANNNRDDEGNNVIAFEANDNLDDLQPLIDVLENDIENENDIYVLQNGFPMWLLRILEMANPIDLENIGGAHAQLHLPLQAQAGGDAANVNADNDEGFDSSSVEDDSDIEDDDADDATSVSSNETEDHSDMNPRRDWRAGGDP